MCERMVKGLKGMKFIVLDEVSPAMTKEDMERLDKMMNKYGTCRTPLKERGKSYRSGSKQRKESNRQNSKRGQWKSWNEIYI